MEIERVLVTGATGFIGKRLVDRLAGESLEVACLVRPGRRVCAWEGRVRVYEADLTDRSELRRVIHEVRPTHVIHLAATGVTRTAVTYQEAVAVNLLGTLALFEMAVNLGGAHRLVQVGTCYEYAAVEEMIDESVRLDPANTYAASKAAATLFCRLYARTLEWPVVIVRPFSVYGPGQPRQAVIPAAIDAALRGDPFRMTGGEQGRDWVYVDDVVEGIWRAMTVPGIEGEEFNLCTGREVTVGEVVDRVMHLLGNPVPVLRGALPYRPDERWHLVGDPGRAREGLGWEAKVSLEDGLERTVHWYRRRW